MPNRPNEILFHSGKYILIQQLLEINTIAYQFTNETAIYNN